jgi:hypothetical protein
MKPFKSLFITALLVSAASSLPACYAEATPDAVYVDTAAPGVDITTYPHEEYQGQTVYWVNDRWYARSGDRWHYYRNEPAELRRRRAVGHAEHARR